MNRSPIYIAALVASGLSLTAGIASAQQQRPPAPDFGAIASALDVSESALMECLGDRPEPGQAPKQGQRPPAPDEAAISSCLNDAGHHVTQQAVHDALVAAGPPRG